MSDKKYRVLVAGGERSPGAEVILALHDAGHSVRAVVSDPQTLSPSVRAAVEDLRVVDLEADPAPAGICEGIDAVYSSLSLGDHPDWPTPWEIDGAANLALVRRAAGEGVGHFLYVSATGGDQLRFEADVAAAREQVVDAVKPLGMRWTVLRPAGTFAGLKKPFEICRERGTWFVVGGGKTRFNPIHPEDLAEIIVRALDDETLQGKVLDVGGPEEFTLREMGKMACEALGRRPRVVSIPRGMFGLAATGVRLKNANLAREMDVIGFLSDKDAVLGEKMGHRDLRSYFQQLALGG